MMPISLTGFKVIYNAKVFRALTLAGITFDGKSLHPFELGTTAKPKCLEIIAVNEDGNIVIISDEAWRFQFIPAIEKQR